MHLWAHSDASYICEPKAQSRVGRYMFLSDKTNLHIYSAQPPPPSNAAVHVICKLVDEVMSLAQEVESGVVFINGKELICIQQTLEEMGHPQGPTSLQFDNMVAEGITSDTVKQKMSKAMDMRFYWVKYRIN